MAAAALCPILFIGASTPQAGTDSAADLVGDFAAKVSTVAGSGVPGVKDGAAAHASFVYPMGVAVGTDGVVFVADTGGQRIRAIRNGTVTTVAGSATKYARAGMWILGGFRDGPAAQADFNDPMGLAVDSAGRIYVADTDNHCIRLIDHGNVSTFAGLCGYPGSIDGPANAARFDGPVTVAVDPSGGVLIADYGNGVRRIDRTGDVKTIIATKTATGVGASAVGSHIVYATDRNAIHILTGGVHVVIPDAANRQKDSLRPAMDADVGRPFMVAAADDDQIFITDEETGAIRYLDIYNGTVQFVAGPRVQDSSNDGTFFRNGSAAQAGFADSAGVAYDGHGHLFVADAGNRRIRSIGPLNLRGALIPSVALFPAQPAPAGAFRIAVIGSSIVWTNTIWDTSMEDVAEHDLDAMGRRVWVQPVRMAAVTVRDSLSYLDDVLGPTHGTDLAVLVLNDGMLEVEGVDWESVLSTQLAATNAKLKSEGIRLVVAYHPDAHDYRGPDFYRLDNGVGGGEAFIHYGISHDGVVAALKRSGVILLDMWPDFEAWQRAPDHSLLFGTDDKHLSVAGRRLFGKLLAKDVLTYVK